MKTMLLKTKLTLVSNFLILSTAFLFGLTMYHFERRSVLEGIDRKLETAARLAQEILTPEYHNTISGPDSVSPEAYNQIVDRWNRLCTELDLEYIWSLMQVNGQTVFTSGTATSKNRTQGDYATFFEPHSDPQLYATALQTQHPQYRISQDKWGQIRAVLLPFTDSHGRPYLIGASMKMTKVNAMTRQTLWSTLSYSILILLLGELLSLKLARSLSRPIEQLTETAERISKGEPTPPPVVRGSVELASLSASITRMNQAIQQQIQELSSKEENLHVTLRSIGDAVIATDINGNITRMNPVAEELTQWPEKEAYGKPLIEVFNIIHAHTRMPAENPVEKVLATGQIVGLANHTALIARDGAELQIADSGAPIHAPDGKTIGVVLVFRDVTEEYALQEQLRQSQKMDAIGQLAGGVAHDFNNMLTGIISATDLLKMTLPADTGSEKYINIIMKSSERAADLTSKLLSFARRQPIASSVIDIHKTITEASELLQSTLDPRIKLTLNLKSDSFHAIGDPAQLQSCILNMGINASHAMPEGGSLKISTRETELDAAYCQISPFDLLPGKYLEIDVTDSGEGIKADVLPHIFEPFFTTKEPGKGTGLGLAAVFGTIQHHNGSISVKSKPGCGTRFQILLPLTEAAAVVPKTAQQIKKGTGRILVVDDETVMRITTKSLLQEFGYKVHTAQNGLEGLNLFRRDPDAYDLVILDMIMPQMNGTDCFTAMREIRPDLPVLLASGFAHEDDLQEIKRNGLAGFIRKPFRGIELNTSVHNALTAKK